MITKPHLPLRSALAMDDFVRVCTDPADFPGHALSWASDFGEEGCPKLRILPSTGAPMGALPGPDEIWLWLATPESRTGIDALEDDRSADFLPFLNEPERDRLHRFRFARDRWSYGAAHAGLRALLSPLLDVAAHRIELTPSPMGKPSLSRGYFGPAIADALQFNISHTRGMVAVALSGSPVGVDVEPVRHLPDMRQLVIDLMAPEALAAFDAEPDAALRMNLFFRFWSLSEAFIKATGLGLDQGLDSFAFTATGEPRLTRVTPGWGSTARWHLGHAGCGRSGWDRQSAPRPRRAAALAN